MPISLETYNFNGTGSLTYPIAGASFGDSFTIETWIKNQAGTQPDYTGIAVRGSSSSANGLHIYGNKLAYRSGEDSGQGYALEDFNLTNYPLNEWVHIALIVTSGKEFEFYRNFNRISSGTLTNNSTATSVPLSQGDWSLAYGAKINASLALTRIWTTNLSIGEIQNNSKKFIEDADFLFYRLKYDNQNTFNGTVLTDRTFQVDVNRGMLEHNGKHFSLSDNTLIHLPDNTTGSVIEHGIKQGKVVQLDIPFTSHLYTTTVVNKMSTVDIGKSNSLAIREVN